MELQQLRALLCVADTGSVTEAARRLLLTQPAVTRQLRALEDELGCALFDRTTKPILPTPLGMIVVEQARRLLQLSEDLQALVSSHSGTPSGELRLGVVHPLARQVIPPIVREVRQQYPGVRLRLTSSWSSALRREVEEGMLDAAILLAAPPIHMPTSLEAVCLGSEPVTLIASTQTGLKGAVGLEDLRGSVWVLGREGCGYRALLKRTLETAGIPFTVVVEVLDLDLQLQLIAEGIGAGLVARRTLPSLPEEHGLQTFGIVNFPGTLEVWLFHRRHGPIMPVIMPIIQRIVATLLR